MKERLKKINTNLLLVLFLSFSFFSVMIIVKPDYLGLLQRLRGLDALKFRDYLEATFLPNAICPLESTKLEDTFFAFDNIYEFTKIGFAGYWYPLYDKNKDDLEYILARIDVQTDQALYIPDSSSRNKLISRSLDLLNDSIKFDLYDSLKIKRLFFKPQNLNRAVGLWNIDTLRRHFYNIYDFKDSLNSQILIYHINADGIDFQGEIPIKNLEDLRYSRVSCEMTFDEYLLSKTGFSIKESRKTPFLEAYYMTIDVAKQFFLNKIYQETFKISFGNFQVGGGIMILVLVPSAILFLLLMSLAHLTQIKSEEWRKYLSEEQPSYIFCYPDFLSKILTLFTVLLAPILAPITGLISISKSQIIWGKTDIGAYSTCIILTILIIYTSISLLKVLRSINTV